MTLLDFVDRFTGQERPVGNILEPTVIKDQAIAAASFYAGYARLSSYPIPATATEAAIPQPNLITETTLITESEWAIIRPLFLLYLEREEAKQLEASRGLGLDVFGRSSSEIATEIVTMENEIIPHKAFCQSIITV